MQLPKVGRAKAELPFTLLATRQLCYIFQSLQCAADEENQGAIREWDV
jgi:hypothetical protein